MIQQYVEYLESYRAKGTTKNYRNNLLAFQRFLGEKKIEKLIYNDFVLFMKHLKNKKLAHKTISHYLYAIRSFTEYLWEESQIDDKLYLRIKNYKGPILEKNRIPAHKWVLSQDQITKGVTKLIDSFHRMIFWVGVNYGLRNSEFQKLQVADINLKDLELHIRDAKRYKNRQIPILQSHVHEWKTWLELRKYEYNMTHSYVFGHWKQHNYSHETYLQPLNTDVLRRRFNHVGKLLKFDKPLTAHTLRFTFGTNLYWKMSEKGIVDLELIRLYMGHSSTLTTENYLMLNKIRQDEKYRALLEE